MSDDLTPSEKFWVIPFVTFIGLMLAPIAVLVWIATWSLDTLFSAWDEA